MQNKMKKLLLTGAAIACAGAALASCDAIEARIPNEKDIPIIQNDGVLTKNQLKVIYDAVITSGSSTSERVLNNLLQKISESYYGSFYEIHLAIEGGTLPEFVQNHKIYLKDSDGDLKEQKAEARVLAYYWQLIDKINEKFFDVIKNSSYQERNVFKEEKFWKATKFDGYDLELLSNFAETPLDGRYTKEDVGLFFQEDYLRVYKDYIVRTMLPEMAREKLTKEYLIEKNYGVIGRSYARKVEYIKLSDSNDAAYALSVNNLAKKYAELVIKTGKTEAYPFSFLDSVYKGTVDINDEMADAIYKAAGFKAEDVVSADIDSDGEPDVYSYKQTTLGGYIVDYNKISTSRFDNNSSVYSEFSGSGAYTPNVGFMIKHGQLLAQDNTVDGWYTSSGLSNLPASLKNRLFKVTVANEVDTKEDPDDPDSNLVRNQTLKFGQYVEYNYYLTEETSEVTNEFPYVIYDKDTTSTFIIRVDEAIKSSKLAEGDGSYDKMIWHSFDPIFRESTAREVASLLTDNDTYKKSAKQYFVEKAALAFHDDAVYNYFVDSFPDLFE